MTTQMKSRPKRPEKETSRWALQDRVVLQRSFLAINSDENIRSLYDIRSMERNIAFQRGTTCGCSYL